MRKRLFTAVSSALLLSGPALAQVLVDYRDGSALDMADRTQWSPVAETIGGGVEVLGVVSGSFTAPGTDEVAYLVSNGVPVASDPFPVLDQRIVVFADDAPVADWRLPEDAAYSRPVTAVDLDGDGISEIIVESSFYNMGTLAISVSAITAGAQSERLQTLSDVYLDTCDAGVGEQAIEAGAVSVSGGQLVAETETLECP